MASFLGLARVLLLSLLVSTVVAGTNSTCKNPRIRREWRALSEDERLDWIRAVNCLSTLPHDPSLVPSVPVNESLIPPVNTSSSFYDDLVYVHMDLNIKIHFAGLFFPWHRYYLQYFEDTLIQKCGYKGATPYWDWTLDAHDMYNSPFFDNSSSGIGGWGDPNNDYQIHTGGFKDDIRAYPNPHHVRRNFSVFPFSNPELLPPFAGDPAAPPSPVDLMVNTTMTKENVDYTVNSFEGDFFEFQTYAESTEGIHFGAHLIVAGDMTGYCSNGAKAPDCVAGTKWTPNDPVFFMHHGMVDKIWYDWQNKSPKNKYAFGGGSVTASTSFENFVKFPTGLPPYLGFDSELFGDGFWNVTVWDVMDTMGDTLCYVYA